MKNDHFCDNYNCAVHYSRLFNCKTKNNCCTLFCATRNNCVKCIRILLSRGTNIHEKYYDTTALITASRTGNVKCINILLNKGANIHDRDIHGYTPLMNTVFNGNYKCIKLLIQRGANIHDKSHYGDSILELLNRRLYFINELLNCNALYFDKNISNFALVKTVELENINITDKQIEMLYFVLNSKLNYNYVFDILKLIFGRSYFIKK